MCSGILPGLNATNTLWLQLSLITRLGKWQAQLQLTLSPRICRFPAYFTHIFLNTSAHLMQVRYCHNCLAALLWQDTKELELFRKLETKQLWHNTWDYEVAAPRIHSFGKALLHPFDQYSLLFLVLWSKDSMKSFKCCLCFSGWLVSASMQARCHQCAVYVQ